LAIVDLPAPVGPTNANVSPASITRSTSRSTGRPGTYSKVTCSSRISPITGGSSTADTDSATAGSVSSSSRSFRSDACPDW
jgi:hypothetical protein